MKIYLLISSNVGSDPSAIFLEYYDSFNLSVSEVLGTLCLVVDVCRRDSK